MCSSCKDLSNSILGIYSLNYNGISKKYTLQNSWYLQKCMLTVSYVHCLQNHLLLFTLIYRYRYADMYYTNHCIYILEIIVTYVYVNIIDIDNIIVYLEANWLRNAYSLSKCIALGRVNKRTRPRTLHFSTKSLS